MGAVTTEYRASATITTTGLQTLATASTLRVGWTSAEISNTTNKDLDILISGRFTLNSTAPTDAKQIQVFAYTQLDDSTWPAGAFSAGTPGTEGAATIIDDEQKAATFVLLWSTATDATVSDVHNMPPTSVRKAFGYMPNRFAIFVTHDTGQAFASAVMHSKGMWENVV